MPPVIWTPDSREPSVGLREVKLGKQQNKQNKLNEQWNTRFKELLEYRSEHGDSNVPKGRGKLGTWVNNQRKVYLAGSLPQDRVDRLNSIGFKWVLVPRHLIVPWETRFNELVEYKAEHGNSNVPHSHGRLGSWATKQRRLYKANKLLQDRIDRLNSIGFKWSLRKMSTKVPWETRFNDLVEYKAKNGDCGIPQRRGVLGNWVHAQRNAYKKGKLAQDRIDRLSGIGFDWTPPIGLTRKSRKSRAPNDSESDDDVDEIGALIYDQVMRQR